MSTRIQLPDPENPTAVSAIPFSVEAPIVHSLGAESVSDPVLALIELVKNSYDADAEKVEIILKNIRTGTSEIIVVDIGNGMGEKALQAGWMRISTSTKATQRISPIHKRRMLGQKGIGRFAVENLSRKTTITSYPRDEAKGFRVAFDWDAYSKGSDLSKVTNPVEEFTKQETAHGLKIELKNLRHKWHEDDVQRLWRFVRSLTPPATTNPLFQAEIVTDEFIELAGPVQSTFLDQAVFRFEAKLSKDGVIQYKFWKHGVEDPRFTIPDKESEFSCGPMTFKLHFYYRQKNKMKDAGIEVPSIETMRAILDNYGSIKLYRDGIRLSGFGNPGDDWTGLDSMARNDPTVIPAMNQVIGTVSIDSELNPEINDTTTRENLIKNPAYLDMLKFIRKSIDVFAEMRGQVENKRQPAPRKSKQFINRAVKNAKANINRPPLLDFAPSYPQVFYKRLEDELNTCYYTSQPNAALILSRKVVENLLYYILFLKFPNEIELRYIPHMHQALGVGYLIENLKNRKRRFNEEQQDMIDRLIPLVKEIRRNAGSSAHQIMDYVKTIDELSKLRISEAVQIELDLIGRLRATTRRR